MTRRSLPGLSLLALLALTLVACGGADAGAPARTAAPPPPQEAPEPRTVEEAQSQIARAADELDGRALSVKATDAAPSAPASEPPNGGAKTEYSADAYANRCENPCRALASMKRAVDALCRMTGESDTKCVDARKTLADNVGKTASCKCSG